MSKIHKRLQIDNHNGTRCIFCNKPLKEIGVVMLNTNDGSKGWAGPKCSRENSINPEEPIADLVRGSYEVAPIEEEEEPNEANAGRIELVNNTTQSPTNRTSGLNKAELITYLILRQEKLVEFKLNYANIQPLYEKFEKGEDLSPNDYQYLHNLKNKTDLKPEMKLLNLRNLNIANTAINKCLVRKPNNIFFEGLKNYLLNHKYLTPRQIENLNKEFNGADIKYRLSPFAFNDLIPEVQ